jgi:Spy/CpxP family protein refolding chaperone
MAEADRRGEAAKAFYATLTPEQQKTFDAHTLRQHRKDGHRGGDRHGMR